MTERNNNESLPGYEKIKSILNDILYKIIFLTDTIKNVEGNVKNDRA
ncbi:hypothetical protein KGR20_24125 [Cytobacillus oceanisediminis]|nr:MULTISPECIES: hypothetical protein [Bacillaceae]MBZ9537231.1 hypothetical protein [Cytobacillus oceanisediminis]UTI43894.1 hypothetical protein NKG37_09745 [Niallia sp. RD1]